MADTRDPAPEYVKNLENSFGGPSREGFGSAVFFETLAASAGLEQAALRTYRLFVGELWERWGEEAWMGPWRETYARPNGFKPDIAAELRAIEDRSAASSVPMILEPSGGADAARAALTAAFDDPSVTELRVYIIGDGEAMSGLMVAGRRAATGDATFLVFLMD